MMTRVTRYVPIVSGLYLLDIFYQRMTVPIFPGPTKFDVCLARNFFFGPK